MSLPSIWHSMFKSITTMLVFEFSSCKTEMIIHGQEPWLNQRSCEKAWGYLSHRELIRPPPKSPRVSMSFHRHKNVSKSQKRLRSLESRSRTAASHTHFLIALALQDGRQLLLQLLDLVLDPAQLSFSDGLKMLFTFNLTLPCFVKSLKNKAQNRSTLQFHSVTYKKARDQTPQPTQRSLRQGRLAPTVTSRRSPPMRRLAISYPSQSSTVRSSDITWDKLKKGNL